METDRDILRIELDSRAVVHDSSRMGVSSRSTGIKKWVDLRGCGEVYRHGAYLD